MDKNKLEIYCNKHSPRIQVRAPENRYYKQAFRHMVFTVNDLLVSNHNCQPFFITLSPPDEGTIQEQWLL